MYHLINVQSLRRSLQTLCVFYYMVEPMIYLSIFLAMMLSPLCPIPIAYCIYYFVDRGQEKWATGLITLLINFCFLITPDLIFLQQSRRGGRRIPWLRKLSIWRWIGKYNQKYKLEIKTWVQQRNILLFLYRRLLPIQIDSMWTTQSWSQLFGIKLLFNLFWNYA